MRAYRCAARGRAAACIGDGHAMGACAHTCEAGGREVARRPEVGIARRAAAGIGKHRGGVCIDTDIA